MRLRRSKILLLILWANALDLSTSAFPWYWDHVIPIQPRPSWELAVQLVLLLPLTYCAIPGLKRLWGRVSALPIPRPAAVVLGLYLLMQVGHVALRMENYPFTLVGMFSVLRPPFTQPGVLLHRPAFPRTDGYEPISVMREGNPFFRKYLDDIDYKVAWFYLIYAKQLPVVHRDLAQRLAAKGLPVPEIVLVDYRFHDGAATSIQPLYRLPPEDAP